MAGLSALLFQQFPDLAVEARYRLDQRRHQAKFTRALAIIAAGMFLTYTLFNPFFITWQQTLAVA
ncbi:MAG TPA: hypothetical protein VM055_01430, partial [Novosphingobium sp.]|nr:hypothetical protein [Novosphingobium sp.]